MFYKKFGLGLIIGILMVNVGWSQNKVSHFPTSTGMHEQVLQIGDFDFRYTIAIPASYSESKAVPLILSLHYGFNPNAPFPPYYGKGLLEGLMIPALAELDAIIIAPDSHGKRWHDPGIEKALLKLLSEIKRRYRIDPEKTLITGYSMGGIGTWHLVASYPELFSAAIPISGKPSSDSLRKISKIPLYVLHGQDDELFPVDLVAQDVEQLRKKGNKIEFRSLPGITHYEISRFIQSLQETIPWIQNNWKH